MRTTTLTSMLALGLALGALPLAAFAQDAAPVAPAATPAATPPARLAALPDLASLGQIAGMDAFYAPGSQFVWLKAPDGKHFIAGMVFDEAGTDVSSSLAGVPSLDMALLTGEATPEQVAAAAAEAAGVSSELAVTPEEIGISEAPATAPASETDLEVAAEAPAPVADATAEAPAPVADATPEAPAVDAAAAPATPAAPADAMAAAQETLEDLPEAKRTALLIALVDALRGVQTQDEFEAAYLAWEEKVRAEAETAGVAMPDAVPAPVEESSAAPVPETEPVPVQESSAAPAVADPAQAPAAEPAVATETPAAQPAAAEGESAQVELLDATREGTMWFSIGSQDPTVPVIYAYIDPTCPFCARAITQLRPKIDAGELQLRVTLAPLVSDEAPKIIAGILSAEDPLKTFLDHEVAFAAHETSPVEPIEFNRLPDDIEDGIRANYEMVMRSQIPGVPFFAWATAEGPAYLSGVPEGEDPFAGALPDTFTPRSN